MGRPQRTGSLSNPSTSAQLSRQSFPMEWLDSRSWRLPSGQALAEFALQAGFLAPLLLHRDLGRQSRRTRMAKGTTAVAIPSTVPPKEF